MCPALYYWVVGYIVYFSWNIAQLYPLFSYFFMFIFIVTNNMADNGLPDKKAFAVHESALKFDLYWKNSKNYGNTTQHT